MRPISVRAVSSAIAPMRFEIGRAGRSRGEAPEAVARPARLPCRVRRCAPSWRRASAGADRARRWDGGAERGARCRCRPVAVLRLRGGAEPCCREGLRDRSVSPGRGGLRPGRAPRRGRRGGARCGVLRRAWASVRRPGGLVLRSLSAQRPHHVEPGAVGRARAAEPVRRSAVPHERDRRESGAWVRRERVGGADACDRRRGASRRRPAGSSLRDAESRAGGASKDSRILKALVRHNRIDVAGTPYPCAGIYAVAEATGAIHRGDPVRLL